MPTNRVAAVAQLIPRADYKEPENDEPDQYGAGVELAPMRGTPYALKREFFLSPGGSFCTPPPHGALVAISLRSGKLLWSAPLGTGEGLERLGLGVMRDAAGMLNLGGAITTAGGLVFIGATLDAHIRAFDAGSGEEVWKAKLPAGGKATPMTYLGADGRQFVVISAGSDGKAFGRSDDVVAYALPR